jgi:glycine betaine transporter
MGSQTGVNPAQHTGGHMFRNPLLITAMALTAAVAAWGVLDTASLAQFAQQRVSQQFNSRAWFVMLTVSGIVICCLVLALSPYGKLRLGKDDERPEFSTVSWLTMLFAAGMGVGLLFYAAAEPLTHYSFLSGFSAVQAPRFALAVTNFNWGIHAWALYGITALVIAYFSYRKDQPGLIGTPIRYTFRRGAWVGGLAWVADLLAIYAIAIGLAGSLAMGVFQVQGGIAEIFGWEWSLDAQRYTVFGVLCLAFLLPLTVDLSSRMAKLSNVAMLIAVALMIYLLLVGPTHYFMNGIVDSIGYYLSNLVSMSFSTLPFMGSENRQWFNDWTLSYMVWWIAWAPFVGVFVARISRGRSIREFLVGVIVVPTLFSVFWFGVFGGASLFSVLEKGSDAVGVALNSPENATFFVMNELPLSWLTSGLTILAAFVFLITSVVSAAFVLSMFSTGGDENPPVRVKLAWGGVLALLGLAMMLTGDVLTVRNIIALGAMSFIFVLPILVVAFLKTLRREETVQ